MHQPAADIRRDGRGADDIQDGVGDVGDRLGRTHRQILLLQGKRNQDHRIPPASGHRAGNQANGNALGVFSEVTPFAQFLGFGRGGGPANQQAGDVFHRREVGQVKAQKLFPVVPVKLDRGIVHLDEAQILPIQHEHRHRRTAEQRLEKRIVDVASLG